MEVLQNERKASLAAVRSPASFAYRAGRRMQEKCPIVRLPIVVAGCAEPERAREDQKCRGEPPPVVIRVDQRRIERREIRSPGVELSFEGPKCGINSEKAEDDDDGQNFNPPCVSTQGTAECVDPTIHGRSRHGYPLRP